MQTVSRQIVLVFRSASGLWAALRDRSWRTGLVLGLLCCVGCASHLDPVATRRDNAALDLAAFHANGPEITTPVTLDDAIEYALQHNIDVWVAAQERRFQEELATHATLKLLPSLSLGQDYSQRSNRDAASSRSIITDQQSLEPSYSSERLRETYDVTATWNLLDFGISFFRARQQSSRVAIAVERERRARQNLALAVQRAYWRAVTTRETAEWAERIETGVAAQLAALREQIDAQTVARADALREQARLLELTDELRRYTTGHAAAKVELAALMGLAPGAAYELAPLTLDCVVRHAEFDVAELEHAALLNRPELFEKDFEHAISRDEVRLALLRMFPHISLYWSFNRDENLFLVHNEWNTLGIRSTWDLLTIPQQIQQSRAYERQTELIERQRMAVAIGILTQLRLALIEYEDAFADYELTGRISDTRGALVAVMESAAADGKVESAATLAERLRYLKARAKHLSLLAEVKLAEARILNSVGHAPSVGAPVDDKHAESSEQPEVAEDAA